MHSLFFMYFILFRQRCDRSILFSALCLDWYSNLCDVIRAVFASVGWPLQINGTECPGDFNAVFLRVIRQRPNGCGSSLIGAAIIDAQGRRFCKIYAFRAIKAAVYRDAAHKIQSISVRGQCI